MAAVFWVFSARKALARGRSAADFSLELSPTTLTLADGEGRHHIGWEDVDAVELDDERLVVRVIRRDGGVLVVEPRYRGLSLEELHRVIEESWTGAARALDD